MDLQQSIIKFKSMVQSGDNKSAFALLSELKKQMLELDSLPPMNSPTANAAAERKVARQVFEFATILSVNMGDKDAFQRNIASLRPFYDSKPLELDAESEETMNIVLGLNLLYLLVENRLADFHCELELLTDVQRAHKAITFCTSLDKHLVVGAYDQVLVAAAHPPIPQYSFFLKSLLETVRINIGECVAAAYDSLSLTAATKILMFDNQKEALAFISETYPDWQIVGDRIALVASKHEKSEEIPSLKLISQNLAYATELERIV